jgi:hypothetical protein
MKMIATEGAMRKGLLIGSITVALVGIGGYFYFATPTPAPIVGPVTRSNVPPKQVDDGGGETSDVIEPIGVDSWPTPRPTAPGTDDGPMPRVMLAPGVQQPPRPDVESGGAPRMPYAVD